MSMSPAHLPKFLTAAAMAAVLLVGVSSCKSSTNPSSKVTVTVRVDAASCSGKTFNVQVYFDGPLIGTIQPGDNGTSVNVAQGDHTISALGGNGYTWAIRTITVGSAGANEILTCS